MKKLLFTLLATAGLCQSAYSLESPLNTSAEIIDQIFASDKFQDAAKQDDIINAVRRLGHNLDLIGTAYYIVETSGPWSLPFELDFSSLLCLNESASSANVDLTELTEARHHRHHCSSPSHSSSCHPCHQCHHHHKPQPRVNREFLVKVCVSSQAIGPVEVTVKKVKLIREQFEFQHVVAE